jgi:metal-dependent HD superfamily phosphatase/phosphodiesterase
VTTALPALGELGSENEKLAVIAKALQEDGEVAGWWQAAVVNAHTRSGAGEEWSTSIGLVPRLALEMFRIASAGGVVPSVVRDYRYGREDAEIVVALAASLRFVRVSVDYEVSSGHLFLVARRLPDLLEPVYDEPDRTVMTTEVLHGLAAEARLVSPLTLEAEIVRLAAALEGGGGGARFGPSPRALAGREPAEVVTGPGHSNPLRIELRLENAVSFAYAEEAIRDAFLGTRLGRATELVVVEAGSGAELFAWTPESGESEASALRRLAVRQPR